MQLFLFLKPDAVLRSPVRAASAKFLLEETCLEVRSAQWVEVSPDLVSAHYHHVRTRDFYPWLVAYTTASSVLACIVETPEPEVAGLRERLGSTLAHEADASSFRRKWGIFAGINCLHVSDSREAAEREISLWSSEAAIQDGVLDVDLNELAETPQALDHTKKLREVCYGISARGESSEADLQVIYEILSSESPASEQAALARLAEVVMQSALR